MFSSTTSYSLSKSRQIFKTGYQWYKSKRQVLTSEELNLYEIQLNQLDQAIVNGNQLEASDLAHSVENFYQARFKKSLFNYLKEFIVAIVVALLVATLVRQVWFELYEIPTGSMRPTFEEQDRLTVTKTAFSLNVPLMTKHFYFDPNLVQRGSVVIWSGDGIPHLDSDSKFMNIFPYTKRYIKRCMGKPGDTLYFYGGLVYGFDKDGKDLVELREAPWLKGLDHVPFTFFEGRTTHKIDPQSRTINQMTFHLFNQPIGRLRFGFNQMKGEIFNGSEWVEDQAVAQQTPHQSLQTYSDFFGIRNYAKARLLTKEQLELYTSFSASEMEEALYYLELQHNPSLSFPPPFLTNYRSGVFLRGYTTVIPLQQKHVEALKANLYTGRFVVKNQQAASYRAEHQTFNSNNPKFKGVPDGTYEFYYGKGSSIGFGGIPYALPLDHPLYQMDYLQKLFNTGIEMHQMVEPQQPGQAFFPSRYAYFRGGALYVMGGLLMTADDPILINFKEKELAREKKSIKQAPYVAFKDYGPPLTKEGKLDQEWMKTFGLTIPDGQYLVLGDNHAMSQDSRWFGPIPANNLQGAPSLIIWPPGDRFGIPAQKPYPLLTVPRLIVWSLVSVLILLWWFWRRRQLHRHLFKKLPTN